MPVLINKSSGLAEDLQSDLANSALQAETHEIPFNDPQGNAASGGLSQAQDLLSQGYTQPTANNLQDLLKQAKYSSPSEQVKSALSGIGKGATFGLSSALEDPEAHLAREQVNPGLSKIGELAGLAGSSLIPVVGEANILGKAGRAASEIAGVGEASTLAARAAASAVKQMTEMAMLQGGDEVSKAFSSDPNQSMETALVDIGLSGLLGGALGGAGKAGSEALWGATQGPKLASFLTMVKNKVNGVEVSNIAADMAQQAGLQLSPEVQAAMSGESKAKQLAQALQESGSGSGNKFRKSVESFKRDANESILKALGRTPGDLEGLSDFQSGEGVKKTLASELEAITGPVSDQFEPIKGRFSATPLPEAMHQSLAEDLGQLALKEGYNLSESSPALKEINRIIGDLPNLKTLEDLRKYQAVARDNIFASNIPRLGKQVSSILREGEENALSQMLGKEAPELIEQHAAARADYKKVMETIEDLNDRLRVGKYFGPQSFISSLKEMAPEDVLKRLKGSNDAGLLSLLDKEFPSTALEMRDYHVNSLLSKSLKGEELNSKAFFNSLDKMTPELKQFSVPEEASQQLEAIKGLLGSLPERTNPSGTARTLDTLWKELPGGAGAMISMLLGHNPIAGWALGKLGRYLGREFPDAAKLSLLKFLGSEAEANPSGYKALYNSISSVYKGTQAINRASRSLFTASTEILPRSLLPSEAQQRSLVGGLKAAQVDPELLLSATGNMGLYAPEHAEAMGSVAARASSYLNSLTPSSDKPGILDNPRQPSAVEKAKYERALSIAEQPLLILQHAKDATITPGDLATISTIYPNLTKQLQAKVLTSLADHVSKGGTVSYKTRLGLSMFLGQPLDSSLSPRNVLINQQVGNPAPQPQGVPGKASKGSKSALNKLPSMSATPNQAREQQRMSK
jgi:hypothetical protein